MRILVTGGAGFIGSHVSEAYVRDGHEVLVLDDLSTGCEENVPAGARLEVVDLCEHRRVRTLLEDFRPQLINHHAAQVDIRRSVADPVFDVNVNVVATIHLLQGAVEIGADGILFASSGGAISGETRHPVAEEAAITAEAMGSRIDRLYDAGVAGVHRLLHNREKLESARVLIVVAGMEGALPGVVGGLVDKPVIAVPTSVGYGANFQGLSALLTMLNTCVPGVAVVNIDNGFGAGYLACLINRQGETE